MKQIKKYQCDSTAPTDTELRDCISLAKSDHCIIRLIWYFPLIGGYSIDITEDTTFEDCKDMIPKYYPV